MYFLLNMVDFPASSVSLPEGKWRFKYTTPLKVGWKFHPRSYPLMFQHFIRGTPCPFGSPGLQHRAPGWTWFFVTARGFEWIIQGTGKKRVPRIHLKQLTKKSAFHLIWGNLYLYYINPWSECFSHFLGRIPLRCTYFSLYLLGWPFPAGFGRYKLPRWIIKVVHCDLCQCWVVHVYLGGWAEPTNLKSNISHQIGSFHQGSGWIHKKTLKPMPRCSY